MDVLSRAFCASIPERRREGRVGGRSRHRGQATLELVHERPETTVATSAAPIRC
ncbi:hypothetical protein DYB38_000620 [Aphanomyces astaci]|uniref:Uncharacterized protein n=1 Tax=Aphanomyces astaci TaxID=112090 RepID=A0A397DC56_APHAT|nr:hypothetical protein DYB38_000620 [Aphanomyces astaci]